jgi:hypothetical protein
MIATVEQATVAFVELAARPARDVRHWFFPDGQHQVTEVVGRFDDVEEARAVAVGLNRQVRRTRTRRWAVVVEGDDAEQVGVGSTIAPATILTGALVE